MKYLLLLLALLIAAACSAEGFDNAAQPVEQGPLSGFVGEYSVSETDPEAFSITIGQNFIEYPGEYIAIAFSNFLSPECTQAQDSGNRYTVHLCEDSVFDLVIIFIDEDTGAETMAKLYKVVN